KVRIGLDLAWQVAPLRRREATRRPAPGGRLARSRLATGWGGAAALSRDLASQDSPDARRPPPGLELPRAGRAPRRRLARLRRGLRARRPRRRGGSRGAPRRRCGRRRRGPCASSVHLAARPRRGLAAGLALRDRLPRRLLRRLRAPERRLQGQVRPRAAASRGGISAQVGPVPLQEEYSKIRGHARLTHRPARRVPELAPPPTHPGGAFFCAQAAAAAPAAGQSSRGGKGTRALPCSPGLLLLVLRPRWNRSSE
ncbi:unnamed protein product, partial [Prorocentrum cordatum]